MGNLIRYYRPEDIPTYKQNNSTQAICTRVLHILGYYHFKIPLGILKVPFGFWLLFLKCKYPIFTSKSPGFDMI